MLAQAAGNLVTLAALEDVDERDLHGYIKSIGPRMWKTAGEDKTRVHSKLAAAKARYRFV